MRRVCGWDVQGGFKMNDLIKSWEKLAEKYFEQGRDHQNPITADRLLSSAEVYSVCADQLRKKMEGKIVVLAGNMEQFRYWLRHNIIPVISDRDIERITGCKIKAVYKEGNWYEKLSPETLAEIEIRRKV